MSSKSFLNLNQPKTGAKAANNSSSDDLSSTTSVESHASRRFSDSLKGMRSRRGNSISKDTTKSRSLSSRSSSEARTARLTHKEILPPNSSRRSTDSTHSSLSVSSAEPHPPSSEADHSGNMAQPAREAQDSFTNAPRRLTGWLYNMVSSDNTPSSVEVGAPLSPVREADAIDFSPSSPTTHHQNPRILSHQTPAQSLAASSQVDASQPVSTTSSASTRSKAGALFQSLSNASPNRAVRMTNAATGDNNGSGSVPGTTSHTISSNHGGASSNSTSNATTGGANTGSWVPGGVNFDRAFKFFMDHDPSSKDDEGIWLLGVWHGPRQAGKVNSSEASVLPPDLSTSTSPCAPEMTASTTSNARNIDRPRASSPSSSLSASSPRQSPSELVHASLASLPPLHDRASIPTTRNESRVGSSISTAATASTSNSIRTKSSTTSFSVVNQASIPAAVDRQFAFQPDFASRIWCTYRNHFAPISRDGTISDQAASAAENMGVAQESVLQDTSASSTCSAVPSSSEATRSSSPPASTGRGWLGRKTAESNAAQDAALQANSPLGLGAALGAGYANASSTLGERMGITNLWSRATAAAQAAGFSRAGLTTDSGWGCMLRTGQSLLANALLNVHLGRSWLREAPPMRQMDFLEQLASLSLDSSVEMQSLQEWREKRARHAAYIKILSWFLDDPSPACPFGVHRMAREGKRLGKEVGEWFGPSTAAGAIKQLVTEFPDAGIAVELAHDGVFYLDEVRLAAGARSALQSGKGRQGDAAVTWRRPVVILIGIRLGLDSVNPIYYESVKETFSFPHSVGIAGGRPSSSYYFMGHQGNSLFYLDPHNVRPAVALRYPPSTFPTAVPHQLDVAHRFALEDKDDELEWWSHAYTEAQTSTFHCEKVRRMPIKSLDPSMLLGFLVKDEEDLMDLCTRIKGLPKTIFSFAESAPKWVDDDDFDPSMESISEPSVDEESEVDGEDKQDVQATHEGEPMQRTRASANAEDTSPASSKGTDARSSDKMFRESQQRTAAWLGQGQRLNSSREASHASSVSGGGIAFPSLDLLTPQSEGHALQRPSRSDVRQVSTSSATTTRPARRALETVPAAGSKVGRELTVSQSTASPYTEQTPPWRSPGKLGTNESSSTVHLSDSEVGSGWEEVSDGGTIAPSGYAGASVLRTSSPFRVSLATKSPTTGVQGTADGGQVVDVAASDLIEGDLVSLDMNPPEEAQGGATHLLSHTSKSSATTDTVTASSASDSAATAQDESYFGLTSAHKPLALPRRRSQSKGSPIELATAVPTDDAPPVPVVPAAFLAELGQSKNKSNAAPDLNDSDDDF